jgi:hypothetical protein
MGEEFNKQLLEKLNRLESQISEIHQGDGLEEKFENVTDGKKHSHMLEIDPSRVDSYGDSIELITKSRLINYAESSSVALAFVEREHHNMMGNRFGKHSKLIPRYNDDGTENKINMVWFSGNDVKLITIKDRKGNEKEFYKIRLLVYDIFVKKFLLARIPIDGGKARYEEIQHIGAGRLGEVWTNENAPLTPMSPKNYKPTLQQRPTVENAGTIGFNQQEKQ